MVFFLSILFHAFYLSTAKKDGLLPKSCPMPFFYLSTSVKRGLLPYSFSVPFSLSKDLFLVAVLANHLSLVVTFLQRELKRSRDRTSSISLGFVYTEETSSIVAHIHHAQPPSPSWYTNRADNDFWRSFLIRWFRPTSNSGTSNSGTLISEPQNGAEPLKFLNP